EETEVTEAPEASVAGPTSTVAKDDRWGEVKSVSTLPATGIGVLAFQAQSAPADDDWNRELFLILVLASLVLVWVLAWPVMTRLIERSAEAKAVESGQWPHGEGEGT